jgi:hypothetical protein
MEEGRPIGFRCPPGHGAGIVSGRLLEIWAISLETAWIWKYGPYFLLRRGSGNTAWLWIYSLYLWSRCGSRDTGRISLYGVDLEI